MILEDLVFEIIENEEFLKKRFNHLGPEPFNSNFTLEYICSKLRGKQKYKKFFD